jgi:hypothetical protein
MSSLNVCVFILIIIDEWNSAFLKIIVRVQEKALMLSILP